ncbi:MAG: LysR family transcriptional regulator [Pseudomonadota bacterium]|nr:LysR family transcriptional regulator [Pseudomonadota bacterium]
MTYKWDDLRYFLATARSGKISSAARTMQVDHSTVSRKIRDLEDGLGLQLFEKSPAGYLLTDDGRRLLPLAEQIETGTSAVAELSVRAASELQGQVRVGAPDGFAALYLAPRLAGFAADHPRLRIEVLSAPRWLSLSKRDADIAISLSRATSGRQKTVKLTSFTMREYVRNDMYPRQDTLPRLGYITDLYYDESLEQIDSFSASATVQFSCSSALAQCETIASGHCKGVLADFVAARNDLLVPCHPDAPPLMRELWLRYHEDLASTRRVRNVVDFLLETCRKDRNLFLPDQGQIVRRERD